MAECPRGKEPGLYPRAGGSGRRAQAAAPPQNVALLPQLTDTLLAWGGVALPIHWILKAASFGVFLLCGSKESLSWRSRCPLKGAAFERQPGRPALEVHVEGEAESSSVLRAGLARGLVHVWRRSRASTGANGFGDAVLLSTGHTVSVMWDEKGFPLNLTAVMLAPKDFFVDAVAKMIRERVEIMVTRF